MRAKCKHCGLKWETQSTYVFVNCPSCRRKVQLREVNEDGKEKTKISKKG